MTSNLPSIPNASLPRVTDEKGNPLVDAELEGIVKLVTQMAQTAQLARIRQALEREQFEGKSDNRILTATANLQTVDLVHDWPYSPWVEGTFRNRGPGIIEFSVNDDRDFRVLRIGESDRRDHSKAGRRIEKFFYRFQGQTATFEVEGKY